MIPTGLWNRSFFYTPATTGTYYVDAAAYAADALRGTYAVHVAGGLPVARDFNFDGHSDFLWQNDSGEAAIWEMNGTSVIGGGSLGNPGSSWHSIRAGDFNGDGESDILWQNTSGQAVAPGDERRDQRDLSGWRQPGSSQQA
jgi:hypothetical protein